MKTSLILSVVITAILIGCKTKNRKDTILDVKEITNKRANEVTRILGEPDSVYNIKVLGHSIYCQLYQPHNIEIQYFDGLATDIVIYGPHGLPFNQSALASFNIDYKTHHPTEYKQDQLIRWSNVEGFSAISFYNVQTDSLKNIKNFNIFFKFNGSK